jgi:hypothetical protein
MRGEKTKEREGKRGRDRKPNSQIRVCINPAEKITTKRIKRAHQSVDNSICIHIEILRVR